MSHVLCQRLRAHVRSLALVSMVPHSLHGVVLTAVLLYRYRSVPLAHAVFGHAHKPPPLLILHGLFGSGRNWRSLAARLAEDTHRLVISFLAVHVRLTVCVLISNGGHNFSFVGPNL